MTSFPLYLLKVLEGKLYIFGIIVLKSMKRYFTLSWGTWAKDGYASVLYSLISHNGNSLFASGAEFFSLPVLWIILSLLACYLHLFVLLTYTLSSTLTWIWSQKKLFALHKFHWLFGLLIWNLRCVWHHLPFVSF